jgi:sigma-B regulation protein RsbU (phosphoserine phosphatase)
VADVAGKGTAAALLTTMLRSAVHAHWRQPGVDEAVRRINRTVSESVPEFRYITFFLGRFDTGSCELAYVNAGHNAPLVIRQHGEPERLDVGGTVLGLSESSHYEQGRARLARGDLLVAFSDGVSEASDGAGGEFGEQGIEAAARAARDGSAEEIRLRILEEASRFSRGARPDDDRTLVVLKCR